MASYQCDRCLKRFSSYYNVRRHKANQCAYAKIDDNASMEGGGSSYSDEESVDSFPDEESSIQFKSLFIRSKDKNTYLCYK
jgi:hypothetical protein